MTCTEGASVGIFANGDDTRLERQSTEIKMGHGGKREGAGRPKGSKNLRSRELAEAATASGLLPHEFLLAVVRGEKISLPAEGEGVFHVPTFDQRLEAAKAAAPYFASRLAAIEHSGADGGPIDHSITVTFVKAAASGQT